MSYNAAYDARDSAGFVCSRSTRYFSIVIMCETTKSQRRTYRDQDPPRITDESTARRTRGSSETEDDASGYDDGHQPPVDPDPDLFGKEQQQQQQQHHGQQHSRGKEPAASIYESSSEPTTPHRDFDRSSARNNTSAGPAIAAAARRAQTSFVDDHRQDNTKRESLTIEQVPYSTASLAPLLHFPKVIKEQVITNGVKRKEDSCEVLTNGREMAPAMGVPPPPPPAPHMGPDGLILPRKPYNPCLISNNHKDLRKELLFNQKIGRSVLNQKSELQRALEKQREIALRREAEKNREETYKDDPRTALQRALEQRARHIQLTEQPQITEPANPLVNARAKLRSRTESQ